ncbi:hypothetical protein TNCV_3383361 [Trichonephila clavipes]|nr:hypothetical protein TNCV_3383361 [Trichonephila clavipes]
MIWSSSKIRVTRRSKTETTHQRAPRPSYNHERYQRFHGFLTDATIRSCSLRKTQGYSSYQPKLADFHDAKSRQRPCRMIMQHVKDLLSVSLAWVCRQN